MTSPAPPPSPPNTTTTTTTESPNTNALAEKQLKFKTLLARKASSTQANHQAVIAEHRRLKLDNSLLSRLERKKADAEQKLAKQDAEEAGEEYERKRAWDWTIEESLKCDERRGQKSENRDKAGFAGTMVPCFVFCVVLCCWGVVFTCCGCCVLCLMR